MRLFTLKETQCIVNALCGWQGRDHHGMTDHDILYHGVMDGLNKGLDVKWDINLDELDEFHIKMVNVETESTDILHKVREFWTTPPMDSDVRNRLREEPLYSAGFRWQGSDSLQTEFI